MVYAKMGQGSHSSSGTADLPKCLIPVGSLRLRLYQSLLWFQVFVVEPSDAVKRRNG